LVTRVFTDSEIEFLRNLALLSADNSTVLGSFRDAYPDHGSSDLKLIAKYRAVGRDLTSATTRAYCIGCGKMVYLLEGEDLCPSCR